MNDGTEAAVERPGPCRRRSRTAITAMIGIVALAAVIRIHGLRDHPGGLFCDEAALGYNAYSILKCGMDENGVRFPLYVWSFGGYKNPVYIYAAIAPIALLGLDEFSLRLTSVMFGLLTVWGLYLLVAEMRNRRAGAVAAFLLAVCPWHIHFSRIAFELVSLPALFVLGFYFLVRGVRRDSNWCWVVSALFFGSTVYAYAPSRVGVPLFLLGATVIYARRIWRRKLAWLLSVLVFLAVIAPSVHFSYVNRERSERYFQENSILKRDKDPKRLALIFWENYKTFFGREFLFEDVRDPARRHGVRNFGVYPYYFLPLAALGILCGLLRRDGSVFLTLWWLALYPVAASLMDEIPSASRSFIGVPIFPVLGGYGLGCLLALGDRLRWKRVSVVLQAIILAALAFFAARELKRYLHDYFTRFSPETAGGIYGFQYGYRDTIRYMELCRKDYDLLMLTSTSVNQPYIFALFYSGIDPAQYIKTRDPGYLVLTPKEYRRYSTQGKKVLYALSQEDLKYFSDYEKKLVVRAPDGVLQFIVAEVRERKNYITTWQSVGLFPNKGGQGRDKDFIGVRDFDTKGEYEGAYGPARWSRMSNQFVQSDFNQFYMNQPTDGMRGNPEEVCAYEVTYVTCPSGRSASLEISGSPDYYSVWLNRKPLKMNGVIRAESACDTYPVTLHEGENELLVKSCEGAGDWYVMARLISPDGKDFSDLSYNFERRTPVVKPTPVPVPGDWEEEEFEGEATEETEGLEPEDGNRRSGETAPEEETGDPEETGGEAAVPAAKFQLVEGFGEIAGFAHTQKDYVDVRGGAEGWWEYFRPEGEEVSWDTAACPAKKDTVFVFFGQTGEDKGKADLLVDGKTALTFDTGIAEDASWSGNGYTLSMRGRGPGAGHCGLYFLTVPASAVEEGMPCRLTVTHTGGERVSWFMIKSYEDNIAREGVTEESVPMESKAAPPGSGEHEPDPAHDE